jgi:hypothetical protein
VLVERITRLLRVVTLTGAATLLQAITIVERLLQEVNYAPQVADSILQLMEAIAAQARKQLRDIVEIDEKLRWKTDVIDIVLTIAVGLYRDRVVFAKDGLDSINHLDYREWLRQHGATNTALKSRFLAGIYDLVFAYRHGDRTKPELAAGVALRGALRMFFTYRGAMFWRMRSGMGDAVFAPLYSMLRLPDWKSRRPDGTPKKRSPVTFHFLHELSAVELGYADGRPFVQSITFKPDGDAEALDAASATALDDSGTWPKSGDARFGAARKLPASPVKLTAGAAVNGFDAVVFALGVDDFVDICTHSLQAGGVDVIHSLPEYWTSMQVKVATVATQVGQVWVNRRLEELGWYRGPGLITAMDKPFPFQTWADTTHTVPIERAWRRQHNVKRPELDDAGTVAYFCGVLADDKAKLAPAALEEQIGLDVGTLVVNAVAPFWPSAGLADAHGEPVKVLKKYVHPNVAGSDRYTLSLPGSIEHRISPLDRSVLNMTIAGDWTACGLDAGCVEAAVMSGMLAAHAIAGAPALAAIVGFDHP